MKYEFYKYVTSNTLSKYKSKLFYKKNKRCLVLNLIYVITILRIIQLQTSIFRILKIYPRQLVKKRITQITVIAPDN